MAAVDTAASLVIIAESLCKRYHIPVDRSRARPYSSLGNGGGGVTVGSAIVSLDLCLEGLILELGVVPVPTGPSSCPHRFCAPTIWMFCTPEANFEVGKELAPLCLPTAPKELKLVSWRCR